MDKAQRFRNIATKVRQELDLFRTKSNCTGFCSGPDLGGLCYYGAAMLYESFREHGFGSAEIAAGEGHWYLICDEYLVDVTASQFGMGNVVVRQNKNVKHMIKNNKKDPRYSRKVNFWNTKSTCDIEGHGVKNWFDHIKKAREMCKNG